MDKVYFENEESEDAYYEDYFQNLMKENGLTEMQVIEADLVTEADEHFVFCKDTDECYPKNECNIHCLAYQATSKDEQKCIFKGELYVPGNPITLKFKD